MQQHHHRRAFLAARVRFCADRMFRRLGCRAPERTTQSRGSGGMGSASRGPCGAGQRSHAGRRRTQRRGERRPHGHDTDRLAAPARRRRDAAGWWRSGVRSACAVRAVASVVATGGCCGAVSQRSNRCPAATATRVGLAAGRRAPEPARSTVARRAASCPVRLGKKDVLRELGAEPVVASGVEVDVADLVVRR